MFVEVSRGVTFTCRVLQRCLADRALHEVRVRKVQPSMLRDNSDLEISSAVSDIICLPNSHVHRRRRVASRACGTSLNLFTTHILVNYSLPSLYKISLLEICPIYLCDKRDTLERQLGKFALRSIRYPAWHDINLALPSPERFSAGAAGIGCRSVLSGGTGLSLLARISRQRLHTRRASSGTHAGVSGKDDLYSLHGDRDPGRPAPLMPVKTMTTCPPRDKCPMTSHLLDHRL